MATGQRDQAVGGGGTLDEQADLQQWMQAQAPYVQKIIDSGDYPMMTKVIRDAGKPHDPDHAKHGFKIGLEQIRDGIAANLPTGSANSSRNPGSPME